MGKKASRINRYSQTAPLLAQTRRLLRRSGLRARKGLAQHFLIDEEVLNLIVSAANLTPADIIMEIGPGLGVLTQELAKRAGHVIAIELDDKLAEVLKQRMSSFSNVTIINADVLEIDPAAILKEHRGEFPQGEGIALRYKVVANLPYYITSAVLRHFLEASLKPESLVVMVQKEVAEAIAAEPGRMSLLSVSVQFYGEPRIVGQVAAACFYPAPEVDSALLRIDVYTQPAAPVADERGFFDLVRAGFSAARKQIANSLAQGLDRPRAEVLPLLERAGISPQRRAETLTLGEWGRLWGEYKKAGESC
jgi:16S rRNA (adenine1518-N6/adenine1519-N6)-dimethyltransferase